MFTGTRNEIISQASKGTPLPSESTTKSIDNSVNNDGQVLSDNMQLVLDGASQVGDAIPDTRDVANTMEVAGDGMVVGSPATGPAAPVVAAVGTVVSTVGTVTNIGLDVSNGNYKSAAKRVVIEGVSGGLSSIARNAPGVDAAAGQIIDTHILFYENIVIPMIDNKSLNENKK